MSSNNLLIGIDPGKNGGIAYLHKGIVKTVKMPEGTAEFQEFIQYLKSISAPEIPMAFVERVNAYVSDSDNRGKNIQIQKLLRQSEMMLTILRVEKIPFVLVASISWQSTLNLSKPRGMKETDVEKKNRFKDAAQARFPQIKVTHANADALHILTFGKIKIDTDKKWIIDRLPKPVAKLI